MTDPDDVRRETARGYDALADLDHAPDRWSPAERPQILCIRAQAD